MSVTLSKPKHVRTEQGRVVTDLPSRAVHRPREWRVGEHVQCHLVTTNLDGTNWEYWCLIHDGGANRPDNDCTGHPLWR